MSYLNTSNKIVPINDLISEPKPENKCKKYIFEGIGWVGSILVLCPYIIEFDRTIDFTLNTIGATGLLIVCINAKQFQSIFINTAWIIGGIYKYCIKN